MQHTFDRQQFQNWKTSLGAKDSSIELENLATNFDPFSPLTSEWQEKLKAMGWNFCDPFMFSKELLSLIHEQEQQ